MSSGFVRPRCVSLRCAALFFCFGHADPRTTRRYDRGRHSLDRHASYTVTAWLNASETEGQN